MKRIILALLILFGAQVCQAATINVPGDSATIQAGIDGAQTGDTVLVANGTFTGDGNRDISFGGKDIVVKSKYGPKFTRLDLQGSSADKHRGFNFINGESSTAELVGFTIKNGYGPYSYSHGNYEGGAMLIENSSPTIKYCIFAYNDGNHQGGAVSCFTSSPTFINCTFVGNSAEYGGGIYSNSASPVLENCIIAFSTWGSAVNCYSGGTIQLTCCDLYGNAGGDYVDCAEGQLAVDGNISADPFFCDPENNVFNIHPTSPCGSLFNTECGLIGALDIGCTSQDLPFAYQFHFDPVMDDSLVTTAAFNMYWTYFDTAATSQNGYEIEIGTDDDWSVAEMWSSGQVVSSDTGAAYSGITLSDDTGYYIRVRVSDGTDWGAWLGSRFYTYLDDSIFISEDYLTIQWGIDNASEGDTVFVRDGTYSGYGNQDLDFGGKNIVLRSESGPELTTLEGLTGHRAFDFHSNEDSTAVVDGFTIDNFATEVPKNGASIYCGNSNPTFKNCIIVNTIAIQASCVFTTDANITWINCTFQDNYAFWDPALYFLNGSYEFINCTFSDHDGSVWGMSYGAGMIENSDVIFENCTFSNNISTNGGGVFKVYDCNAEFNYCVFNNNSAAFDLWDPSGGALAISNCTTMVTNCTFVSNLAEGQGSAIYLGSGDLTIENTIIAFGNNVNPVSCDPAYINNISCTDIYGNAGGDWVGDISAYAGINGNMSLDPIFCDTVNNNYALDTLSPCAPTSPSNDCAVLIGSEPVGCESYVCGDASGDGFVNVSDAVYLLNYIFVGGPPPIIFMSGDTNCDGVVNVSDVVHVLNYIFKGGNDPCDTNGDDIPDC